MAPSWIFIEFYHILGGSSTFPSRSAATSPISLAAGLLEAAGSFDPG